MSGSRPLTAHHSINALMSNWDQEYLSSGSKAKRYGEVTSCRFSNRSRGTGQQRLIIDFDQTC